MTQTVLNSLREWNPQLLRELKGRLKPRNIMIAVTLSLIAQLVITHSLNYHEFDVFIVLSLSATTAMLAIGTFMLMSDLDEEERQGTLNFLRLTPQSATNIFIGKLLGVPCLLYLAVALAIPLQFWSGLLSGFNFLEILGFDILLIFRGVCVLSLALFLGLIPGNIAGLKPWLASAFVLFCLFIFIAIFPHSPTLYNGWDVIKLFYPSALLPYFLSEYPQQRIFTNDVEHYIEQLQNLRWFYLPIGATAFHFSLFYLVNYVLWTRLTWQGIQRLFQNPTATILSKRQSYIITACSTMLCLGFSIHFFGLSNYQLLLTQNLLLFFGLIVTLSPHRSTLQDWMQERQKKSIQKADLISDLVWGEKSPVIIAIAINLIITSVPIGLVMLFTVDSLDKKETLLLGLFLNASFILLCASVAQLMLLMKTPRRVLWTTGILCAIIVLPLIISTFLTASPYESPIIVLFSAFSFLGLENISFSFICVALISQSLVLTVLNRNFFHRLNTMKKSLSHTLLNP